MQKEVDDKQTLQWRTELGQVLRQWMKDNQYSTNKLALELGIDYNLLRKVRHGTTTLLKDSWVYAYLYQRTGLQQADPRRFPPRLVNSQGKRCYSARAWSEEEWNEWVKNPQHARPTQALATEKQRRKKLPRQRGQANASSLMLTPAGEMVTPLSEPEGAARSSSEELPSTNVPPSTKSSSTGLPVKPTVTVGAIIDTLITQVTGQVTNQVTDNLALKLEALGAKIDQMLEYATSLGQSSKDVPVPEASVPTPNEIDIGSLVTQLVERLETLPTVEARTEVAALYGKQLGQLYTLVSAYTLDDVGARERQLRGRRNIRIGGGES